MSSPSEGFVKMSIECFSLALTFLPSADNKIKAKLIYSRAKAILSVNDSTQLTQATKDANMYVKLRPSAKVTIVYYFIFIIRYQQVRTGYLTLVEGLRIIPNSTKKKHLAN